jgi:hypothetical protein
MKKQAYTMIAMAVLVGSMAAGARAQTSSHTELRANIPFQFNVGDKTLPAGEYTVRQINLHSDRAVLQIRRKDGSAGVMIQMDSVNGRAPESAKLIFHRYSNEYFFAEAWVDGDANGLRAPKSRAECADEAETAGLKGRTENIALRVR